MWAVTIRDALTDIFDSDAISLTEKNTPSWRDYNNKISINDKIKWIAVRTNLRPGFV